MWNIHEGLTSVIVVDRINGTTEYFQNAALAFVSLPKYEVVEITIDLKANATNYVVLENLED